MNLVKSSKAGKSGYKDENGKFYALDQFPVGGVLVAEEVEDPELSAIKEENKTLKNTLLQMADLIKKTCKPEEWTTAKIVAEVKKSVARAEKDIRSGKIPTIQELYAMRQSGKTYSELDVILGYGSQAHGRNSYLRLKAFSKETGLPLLQRSKTDRRSVAKPTTAPELQKVARSRRRFTKLPWDVAMTKDFIAIVTPYVDKHGLAILQKSTDQKNMLRELNERFKCEDKRNAKQACFMRLRNYLAYHFGTLLVPSPLLTPRAIELFRQAAPEKEYKP